MAKAPVPDIGTTDRTRWRLNVNEGRQRWIYLSEEESKERPQTTPEKYFLELPNDFPKFPPATSAQESATNGAAFLSKLQLEDGHWGCGYGGPCFLTPGLIFGLYVTESPIPPEWALEVSRYLINKVNLDGGWGLDTESPSTVLGTALNYTTLRILGMKKEHPIAVDARRCLHALGGSAGIPQWGKMWFAVMNLYSWEGINPLLPEIWALPDWLPIHPTRWWLHSRVVYLGASYLYSMRYQMPLNPLLKELREELYPPENLFHTLKFNWNRDNVAPTDLKQPHTRFLKVLNTFLSAWENYVRPSWVQDLGNRRVYELMKQEDENTDYNCLAPVNKAFHMVCIYAAEGPESARLKLHRERIGDYFWMDAQGMRSGGTNGAQVWDTAFIIQAFSGAGLLEHEQFQSVMKGALDFLELSQLRENIDDPYRQQRKGGWPFSTKDNGYIVSDTAAEGLKSVILLQKHSYLGQVISESRLIECVDTILEMQNYDGGFSTYERVRGPSWLEKLNPAEVFDHVMVDVSHVECTSSVISSLQLFKSHSPGYRTKDIDSCILRAVDFLLGEQWEDGSWYGLWGVCFTYAATFALEALAAVGKTFENDARVRKACEYLVKRQNDDGGWGEHYTSCERREYVPYESSQPVHTSWALSALMYAEYPERTVVYKGVKLLIAQQQPTGGWKQEAVEGVFNVTSMISYPNYQLYFPIKALGMYARRYAEKRS